MRTTEYRKYNEIVWVLRFSTLFITFNVGTAATWANIITSYAAGRLSMLALVPVSNRLQYIRHNVWFAGTCDACGIQHLLAQLPEAVADCDEQFKVAAFVYEYAGRTYEQCLAVRIVEDDLDLIVKELTTYEDHQSGH